MPLPKNFKFKKLRRRTGLSKPAAKAVRKIAKKVLLSTAETKAVGRQLNATPSGGAQPLFHNKVYYLAELLATTQGTGDPNDYSDSKARIGDEIQLTSFSMRLQFSSFQPNTWYKAILFWYPVTASLNDALVYFTQGSKLLDRYNTEEISIIQQKIISPGTQNRIPTTLSGDGVNFGARRTQLVTMNGHWKGKRIKYNEGSSTPKMRNIGMAVVAYDSINTLQTTQLAELTFDYKLKFKDI